MAACGVVEFRFLRGASASFELTLAAVPEALRPRLPLPRRLLDLPLTADMAIVLEMGQIIVAQVGPIALSKTPRPHGDLQDYIYLHAYRRPSPCLAIDKT
jgi:hypothetical protein